MFVFDYVQRRLNDLKSVLLVLVMCYLCVEYWKSLKFIYVSIKIKEDVTTLYRSVISKNVSNVTNQNLQYPPSTSKTSHSSKIVRSVSVVSPTQSFIADSNTKSRYLCMYSIGGLGNQMFQFAAAYGIAKHSHMRLVATKHILVRQVFKIHGQFEDNKTKCQLARRLEEKRASSFDQRLFNIKGKMNYFIGVYTQSWKYFKDSEKELRKQFVFKDHISNIALQIIQDIWKKYTKQRSKVTLIGIHVRRGDMINHAFGYRVASKEYFKKAIYYYSQNFKDAVFVVCSNDISWCKQNINVTNKIEFIENHDREVDLAILGSCDHVIQSVGSFSWWAAWLAGGTSVFFQWPAKEGSELRQAYSKDYCDFFYPGWIGMQ
ncbi:hypothetical protein KUTeg_003282 [Tegillarca granosa]|uniref:L-Fucosyltransferase n=1 Tax=Tegillarca granosa TaxID=220873 RepID=A0ABQ9FPX7_TEGGR|nr:hypothetical protein KUTeg_003282 [Tegillarca granosa]